MQIVIDISDEDYEDVKKAGGCYYDFGKAIYYGTPLPEGHGRLIDAELLLNEIHDLSTEPMADLRLRLRNAPTVVEASEVGG